MDSGVNLATTFLDIETKQEENEENIEKEMEGQIFKQKQEQKEEDVEKEKEKETEEEEEEEEIEKQKQKKTERREVKEKSMKPREPSIKKALGIKSSRRCCVLNCTSKYCKDSTVSFHSLPKPGETITYKKKPPGSDIAVNKLDTWKRILKLGPELNPNAKVCSLHFTPNDYLFPEIHADRRVLIKSAVPSQNLPKNSMLNKNLNLKSPRSKRCANELISSANCKIKKKNVNESESQDNLNRLAIQSKGSNLLKSGFININGLIKISINDIGNISNTNNCKMSNSTVTSRDVEVQVQQEQQDVGVQVQQTKYDFGIQANPLGNIPVGSIIHNIKDNAQLSTITGIESFEILNAIVEKVKKVPVLFQREGKLDLRDKIIMTYAKLKHDLSYCFLALIFSTYTSAHCKKIFFDTIKLLSAALKNEVFVEKSHERLKNKIFKIMNDSMPVNLLPISEDIQTVINATIKFNCSVSKDDRLTKTSNSTDQ